MNEYRDCLPSTLFLNKPVHVKTQLLKNSLRVMVLKASSVNSKISSKTSENVRIGRLALCCSKNVLASRIASRTGVLGRRNPVGRRVQFKKYLLNNA